MGFFDWLVNKTVDEEALEELEEHFQEEEYDSVLYVAYEMSEEEAQKVSPKEHRHWLGKE